MNKDIIDLHTHTTASGHAYNTIYEMAEGAASKGIELLGVSDHGPAMEGSASKHYFRASRHVPRLIKGVRILFGIEFNILDPLGTVDLTEEFAAPLDYAIASLHTECIKPGTQIENTSAYLGAMKNPRVFILGHPDDGSFESDFDTIAKAASEQKVLIEINEASVKPGSYRKNAAENALKLMTACKKWNTRIIISSDAHSEVEILQHENAWKILNEVSYPSELIANNSVEKTLSWLNERKSFFGKEA